ncbi:MAG: hypothetical protein H7Z72_25475 [Bacteroidetes bacterium]|nr:hypothetical protein [Fibrella sp.]
MGITVVLMASGVGEVLGLGLLAVGFVAGGLDLFINVLRMVFDFYRQATGATTERELDQAADLFVEIILRGGVDILDILVGRRAASDLHRRHPARVYAVVRAVTGEEHDRSKTPTET